MEEREDGTKVLTGVLNFALAKEAIVVLKKVDGEYRLLALSGDGRNIDHSPQSLLSFVDPVVPCSWCPGKTEKAPATWIVGKQERIFLCDTCAEFEQYKKYKFRERVRG